MAEIVRMPRLSDTMEEGVLIKWHKKPGDDIKAGDILAEIETDKATMDFESFQDGNLLYVGIEEGVTAPVDALIAIIGDKKEDYSAILESEKSAATPETKKTDTKEEEPKEPTQEPSVQTSTPTQADDSGRIKASPLAKKMAAESGIDIRNIQGSVANGRIVKKDVEQAIEKGVGTSSSIGSAVVGMEKYEDMPLTQMRKTIAKRLSDSKFSAPHFYLKIVVDAGHLIEARKRMNETADTKISFNDLIIKAVAASLRKHPVINSSWLGDKIRQNHHINIGVAMAVDEGLLVPVVRFADTKSLSEISTEVKMFSEKAKNKKLQPQDWEGSTFTISNLGMFGINDFTAIINPPDACILAVGGIQQVPVIKNNQVVAGHTLTLSLSCDHRAVDGVAGASFLQTLKNLLEEPVRILI